jgi:hypothetical protein
LLHTSAASILSYIRTYCAVLRTSSTIWMYSIAIWYMQPQNKEKSELDHDNPQSQRFFFFSSLPQRRWQLLR